MPASRSDSPSELAELHWPCVALPACPALGFDTSSVSRRLAPVIDRKRDGDRFPLARGAPLGPRRPGEPARVHGFTPCTAAAT
jgi:hypothetical protein